MGVLAMLCVWCVWCVVCVWVVIGRDERCARQGSRGRQGQLDEGPEQRDAEAVGGNSYDYDYGDARRWRNVSQLLKLSTGRHARFAPESLE